LKTFGFVTYASMGAWHAAVTKGLTHVEIPRDAIELGDGPL